MTTAVQSPVTSYAEEVASGVVVAGRLMQLAAARHLRDLEHGGARGLVFNERKAQAAIDFFTLLRLPDGAAAGQPFILQPWQEFIVGSLFGWLRGDGRRRFCYALVECGRANGKSPLAGGIGLIGLMADRETGAQVYSAATTRDQAKIVFLDAVHMAEHSPSLWKQLLLTVNNLANVKAGSYFRPLAAEANKMDGLRVHIALVDELHEHPNGEVMAKLRTGMKSSQPLLFAVTTAGWDRNSVCYQEHELATKILEGTIENDAYFAYIATLDEGDDWQDEECWRKANPNLGVTVRLETLREEAALAQQIPAQLNDFKRLRLNMWTQGTSTWLSADIWETGAQPPADLKGRPCFAGLHATVDSAALVLWFPDPAGGGDAVASFFVPEDLLPDLEARGGAWRQWAEDKHVEITDGNVTDYELLRTRINALHDTYDIREIGVFRHGTVQLQTQLQGDGLTVVPLSSGFPAMAGPCEEVERLLREGTLRHGGNPVLRWQASNVSVKTDAEGHKRPDQEASGGPIGGMIALLEAMGRAMVAEPDKGPSVYETRGVLVLGE